MNRLKNLVLICGDEEYLKEQKKNELLGLLTAPGSMNYHAFSEETIDPLEIGRLIVTLPMFEDHRTILITDSGWMHGAADRAVLEALEEIPSSTYVIFLEKQTDAGNDIYRLIRKKGEVFRFTAADSKKGREAGDARQEVRRWAREYLRANGRNIDSRILNDLCELTGYGMQNLSTELEKLISYTYGRPPGARITEEDVDRIVSRTLSDRVFDMMGHKLEGRTAKALELLEELYALRVPPMRILYMIVKQYNQAYSIRELEQNGSRDAEILDKTGLKDWQLRRLRNQTARLSLSELGRMLELCAEMEQKAKSGDLPDSIAVEIIITA